MRSFKNASFDAKQQFVSRNSSLVKQVARFKDIFVDIPNLRKEFIGIESNLYTTIKP